MEGTSDRRLSAIYLRPRASGQKKKKKRVVDNGSKITELQSLALSVFNVCVEPSILTITCTMHDDVFRMLDLIVNVCSTLIG